MCVCKFKCAFCTWGVSGLGRQRGLSISTSVSDWELMCWDLYPCKTMLLPGWLSCCLTPPCCRLLYSRKSVWACTWWHDMFWAGWWLSEPHQQPEGSPFSFSCADNFNRKRLSERTDQKSLNTCRDINGWTPSSCGKFHWGGVWFLVHF